MILNRPRWARISRAHSSLVCCAALLLGACHGTTNPPPGTPILTINESTSRVNYAAYIINVDSVSFTQNTGAIVTPLVTSEVMDLTRLNNYTELVEAPAVPAGTYTAVTLVLDYDSAYIAINQNGVAMPATPVDPLGNIMTTVTVTVTLDPNNPLIVNTNEGVRLNVDMNLEASNTITKSDDPASVTVQPFVVVSAAPVDNTLMRARGVYVTTQTLTNAFFMNLRPFYDLFSQLGAVIVNVSPQTYWQINGTTYTGLAGLAQLPNQQANVPVVAWGTLSDVNGITPTFNATSIYVGTSQENPSLEYLTGTVTERSGNTLTMTGVTYMDPSGITEFFATATVAVADTTLVTEDGVNAPNLSINSISVGQQINVSGLAAISSTNALALDATSGQVRLAQTSLWGELVSATPTTATLNLELLDNWQAPAFDFAGTGVNSGSNAVPGAYVVNTNTTNESTTPAGTLLQVNGIVAPFGSAPPAFIASSVTPASATPQTLVVEWKAGATAPFSLISSDGLKVNLAYADLGTTHYIRTGSQVIDLLSLPASPLITTSGADQSNLQLAVGSAEVPTTGISVFNTASAFAAAVSKTFAGTSPPTIYRLVAYGHYDSSSNEFIASRIYVALQETTSTT